MSKNTSNRARPTIAELQKDASQLIKQVARFRRQLTNERVQGFTAQGHARLRRLSGTLHEAELRILNAVAAATEPRRPLAYAATPNDLGPSWGSFGTEETRPRQSATRRARPRR